jgi:hypothetical protein
MTTPHDPWQPDDDEPPFPVRGTPDGWGEAWERADRLDEARWRSAAEAAERDQRALLVMERERAAP